MYVHHRRDGIAAFDATTNKVFSSMRGNHPHMACFLTGVFAEDAVTLSSLS